MDCQIPIDWLDLLEQGLPDEAEEHLRQCAGCFSLVETLRQQLSSQGFGDWLSDVEIGSNQGIPPALPVEMESGQIWLPHATFEFGSVNYEDIDIVPLVIVDGPRTEGDRVWIDVAPLWLYPTDATPVDLVLGSDDTSIDRPWALLLGFQTVVAESQLRGCIGGLSDSGQALLEAASSGQADEKRFGFPLEGPDDERTENLFAVRQFMFQLGALYAAWLAEDMDQVEANGQGSVRLGQPFAAEPAERMFALAAETSPDARKRVWRLRFDTAELEGYLDFELKANLLLFVVTKAEGFTARVRLFAVSQETPDRLWSDPFEPETGLRVQILSHLPVSHWDIEEVGLEPVDG